MEKPRVTEIIRAVGLGKDYRNVDNFYRDRGTAVHKAIELYLADKLDLDSIDESYKGHFAGFLKWWETVLKRDVPPAFKTEVHLENNEYHGTIDLILHGKVVDFKCSKSHDKVAEIQLAGYKKLLGHHSVDVAPALVVQFPGDGTYEVIEYEAPIKLWDATWELYKWKKGIK